MGNVAIGHGETKVHLSAVRRDAAGRVEVLSVRLTSPGLDAACEAYEYDGYESLAEFFEAMAEDWRGFAGERHYHSLEGDLHITASHDRHVRLAVQLNQLSGPGEWSVQAVMQLAAGEDLSNAARAVRSLVSGD